jgi:protein phosphatase methylesterase 1
VFSVTNGTVRNEKSARVSTPGSLIEKLDKKGQKIFVWRADLSKTKEFWEDWFKGLSKAFLSVALPKLLMMAGTDKIDKELDIALMQGKFKLEVVKDVGNTIQEDNPKVLADSIKNFAATFKIHEQADHKEVITSASGKKIYIATS